MRMPANLKKRAITSVVLIAAMLGILVGDQYFEPFTPFLFVCILALGYAAIIEITGLLTQAPPRRKVLFTDIGLIFSMSWFYLCLGGRNGKLDTAQDAFFWTMVGTLFMAAIIIAILPEFINFVEGARVTARLANTLLAICYLGILPCFLLKIRWLPPETHITATLALAATIFVPKLGDVGAYLTGSLIGKHKMTPILSPKKTWEGFIGGMIVSVLTAIAINFIGPEPLFKNGVPEALAFGLVVGLAGVFGDLFESMLKRDGQTKDASQSIPGFGGVLDVVDSVLFAAPVAYLFFVL